jgi:hypothetical protein
MKKQSWLSTSSRPQAAFFEQSSPKFAPEKCDFPLRNRCKRMALVQFLVEVIHRDESWVIGWQRQGLFVWVTGSREFIKNVGIGRVSVYRTLVVFGGEN